MNASISRCRASRASTPCAASCSRQSSIGASSATAACRARTTSGSAGGEEPRGELRGSPGSRRGPEPLKQRRAAEQIEIERVRVMGRDRRTPARRRRADRPSAARPGAARARSTTRSASCHATRSSTRACQTTSTPKTAKSSSATVSQQRIGAALQRPDQARQRREKCGQPQTRDALRAPQLVVPAGGVLPGPHDVCRCHEAGLRPDMLSRQ